MGLAATIMLYTMTSTWAYFQQSDLAGGVLKTSTERTEFFGNLEIWVNSITVLIQIFLTGRLLKWFGVAFTLVALPFLSMVGFAAMGVAASLAMLAVFQVARRAAAYALMRPSREILFTVLKTRRQIQSEERYRHARLSHRRSVRRVVLPRFAGPWLSLNAISWIAVPVTAVWCALSIWLARKQRVLADAQAKQNRSSPLTDLAAPEPA